MLNKCYILKLQMCFLNRKKLSKKQTHGLFIISFNFKVLGNALGKSLESKGKGKRKC